MGDFLIGIGFLLAIIGPLLLLPVIWLLNRFVIGRLVRQPAALAISIGLVILAIAASYLPGRSEFNRLCSEHAKPNITENVHVEGFFRTKMFAYEAADYLIESDFGFVEAPDPYKEGATLRYTRGQDAESPTDRVQQDDIPAPTSRFGVRKTFSQPSGSITFTEKRIYEISSGRELARAAHITYRGGPLSIFMAGYGSSSCPDIRNEDGSEKFRTFYNLESIVLRSKGDRNGNPESLNR